MAGGVPINSLQDLLMLRELQTQEDQSKPSYMAMKALSDGVAAGIAEKQEAAKTKKKQEDAFAKAQQIANTNSGKITTKIDEEGNQSYSIISGGETSTKPTSVQIAASKAGIVQGLGGGQDFALLDQIANKAQIENKMELDADIAESKSAVQKNLYDMTNKMSDDFRSMASIKDYGEIRRAGANIESAYQQAIAPETKDKNAADQALIVSFNKMLDPGSVVRESEFARTPQGQALLAKLSGKVAAITAGGVGLTDQNRLELFNMSQALVNNAKSFAENDASIIRNQAEAFGVPEAGVFGDFFSSSNQTSFSTVSEAIAANLPAGTEILIGGRRAVVE